MKRLVISLLLAGVLSIGIYFISNDFGITWDEPIYMRNGDAYVSWLKNPDMRRKDEAFGATTQDIHPPLRKLAAALTHDVLTTRLGIIDNTRGYRISSLLFVFPLTAAIAYISIGLYGYVIGALVPVMFSFLPHVLFLTPLVTLDYAVAALWFITVITAVKAMKSYGWLAVSGIALGLTMLTKLHGFLLAIPVAGYGLWYGYGKKNWKHTLVKVVLIGVVAVTVYLIGWPWLWTDTISHLSTYFHLQTSVGGVAEYIFGRSYWAAPWWYTVVMIFTTTPAFILALFSVGAYRILQKGSVWERVILLNALYPIIFFSMPGVFRYDWIRLFLPAFPFLSIVAGRGIVTLVRLVHARHRRVALAFILAAWAVTLYTSVLRIHPWESAYYNELVGGVAGARKIGMESEFWGNSYLGVLPWINANAAHPMCVSPTTKPLYYYQAMGQIVPDARFDSDRETCDYYIMLMRQGALLSDPFIKKLITTEKPVFTVSVDGVTLTGVYDIRDIKK